MQNLQAEFNRQKGAVLIVGLIMLLLLTIIGLASIRGSELQERMAGNTRDKNLAFQAAEAGVRAGETFLTQATLPAFNGSGLYQDLNRVDSATPIPSLWTVSQWAANSVVLPVDTLKGVIAPPRYTIEKLAVSAAAANPGSGADIESLDKMGGASEYYRVTSRGLGGTENAEVILQSTYNR
ncbi:MAG TPA: PilX N-terminal domain-containing pilus assembly protein [Cellvibrio sp.]|nr:PilX N-terminal domain-containing pilus assembly protein [Cellvibrio sp.]